MTGPGPGMGEVRSDGGGRVREGKAAAAKQSAGRWAERVVVDHDYWGGLGGWREGIWWDGVEVSGGLGNGVWAAEGSTKTSAKGAARRCSAQQTGPARKVL